MGCWYGKTCLSCWMFQGGKCVSGEPANAEPVVDEQKDSDLDVALERARKNIEEMKKEEWKIIAALKKVKAGENRCKYGFIDCKRDTELACAECKYSPAYTKGFEAGLKEAARIYGGKSERSGSDGY